MISQFLAANTKQQAADLVYKWQPGTMPQPGTNAKKEYKKKQIIRNDKVQG
jgi:hypothetical protein